MMGSVGILGGVCNERERERDSHNECLFYAKVFSPPESLHKWKKKRQKI